jgi:hypothetical protein
MPIPRALFPVRTRSRGEALTRVSTQNHRAHHTGTKGSEDLDGQPGGMTQPERWLDDNGRAKSTLLVARREWHQIPPHF